jgi:hypothetical protein
MKKLQNTLIYTYIWVALSAASLTYISAGLQEVSGMAPAALVFLLTLNSYALIFLVKERHDQSAYATKNQKMKSLFHNVHVFSFLTTGLLLIVLLWEFRWDLNLYRTISVPAILTVSYALPISKHDSKPLREIPGIKILMIAISWGWTAYYVPTLINGTVPHGSDYRILLAFILYIIAITIPFDIRDMRHDKPQMRTLPQVLGLKGAGWLGMVLLIIAALILLPFGSIKSFIVSLGIGIFYAGLMIFLADNEKSDSFYGFWVEASPIVWAIAFWATVIL